MATISDLRRAFHATRYAKNPALLAKKINRVLAKEGFLDEVIVNRFATGGASSGKTWPKLKAGTLRQRKKLGFGPGPILVRSGFFQKAATKGKTTFDEEKIVKHFKDGPAPVYLGKAKSHKSKADATGKVKQISSYAFALNAKRPIYGDLSPAELKPIFARRDQLIDAVVVELLNGGKVSNVL